MPKLVALKFAPEEMPTLYDCAGIDDLEPQEFVVAERGESSDVGFVAGIEWVASVQLKLRREPCRKVLRRATAEEKEAFFVRKAMEHKALAICKEKAREHNLPIKVTRARIDPFDGRVVFHFTSDQRVDFRALVRELSLMLRSRIELWQIGVRDEAKMVDGFGVCGLRTCCSSWLPDFRPIGIKMAKDQDINLPPSKLSGVCGRLLCCLSYEVDQYRSLGRGLKPKGATVTVEGREGVIIDRNVLLQSYTVRFPDGSTSVVTADGMSEIRVPDQMRRMGAVIHARQGALETQSDVKDDTGAEDITPPTRNERPSAPPQQQRPSRRDRRSEGTREQRQQQQQQRPPQPPAEPSPRDAAEDADGAGERDESSRTRRRGRRGGRRQSARAEGTAQADQRPAPESAEPRSEPRPPRDGESDGSRPRSRRRGGRGRRGGGGSSSGGGGEAGSGSPAGE